MTDKQPIMKPGQLGRLGPGGNTAHNRTMGFFERPVQSSTPATGPMWFFFDID